MGLIRTGKIGKIFVRIMASYGCRILVNDLQKDSDLEKHPNVTYSDCPTLCLESDIVSLHVPLTPETHHIIDHKMIEMMKIGFQDLSGKILKDDVLARLLTFPNVVITSHQAFLTEEVLKNIAITTLLNIDEFKRTGSVAVEKIVNPESCRRPGV